MGKFAIIQITANHTRKIFVIFFFIDFLPDFAKNVIKQQLAKYIVLQIAIL